MSVAIDTATATAARTKMTIAERRAMGLRQLAATVRPLDDPESERALPLSGYVCGCCAALLPVGVVACPHCHTMVAESKPRPDHPAGANLRSPSDTIVIVDPPAPAPAPTGNTRDIRRSWLRRPERPLAI